MLVKIVKWGNSTAVRLPAAILKQVRVALGDRLELRAEDGRIVLERTPREYTLDELVSGITKKNRHSAIDFGKPLGREAR